MELSLTPALGAGPAPAESSPDAADPATATAFAALLAGLVAPPPTPVADEVPAGSPTPDHPTDGTDPRTDLLATTADHAHAAPVDRSPFELPTTPGPATGASGSPGTATHTIRLDAPGASEQADQPTTADGATGGRPDLPEIEVPTTAAPATGTSGSPETATHTIRLDAPGTSEQAGHPTAAAGAAGAPHDGPGSGVADGPGPRVRERDPGPAATPLTSPVAAPSAPVEAAGTAAPAAPASPADGAAVVEQLTEQLADLTARRTDGEHELTVRLDPAELGPVELRVHLRDGVVHVHLGAHERSTADLVRQHLPDLRAALESAGIATGGLDVGDHPGHPGPGTPGGDDLPDRIVVEPGASAAPRASAAAGAVRSTDRSLDLLL